MYGTIAKGFKSGGFPAAPQTVIDTEPLAQEGALNYEIGFKSDLLDNLRLNTAFFYTEYEELQIQSFGPTPGCVEDPTTELLECFGRFQTFNAGDAEAKGVELELTWIPVEHLTLSGFYSFLDSEFTDTVVPNSAYPIQTGNEMIHAPRNKYSINPSLTFSACRDGESG